MGIPQKGAKIILGHTFIYGDPKSPKSTSGNAIVKDSAENNVNTIYDLDADGTIDAISSTNAQKSHSTKVDNIRYGRQTFNFSFTFNGISYLYVRDKKFGSLQNPITPYARKVEDKQTYNSLYEYHKDSFKNYVKLARAAVYLLISNVNGRRPPQCLKSYGVAINSDQSNRLITRKKTCVITVWDTPSNPKSFDRFQNDICGGSLYFTEFKPDAAHTEFDICHSPEVTVMIMYDKKGTVREVNIADTIILGGLEAHRFVSATRL